VAPQLSAAIGNSSTWQQLYVLTPERFSYAARLH